MKDLVKPPFATYDVVVYFGAGLFAVPFLIRYLAVPLGLPDPAFLTEESDQVAFEIVRILTIITFVYVLGHIIAFFSSHLIEKALDRFFGKISTAILVSSGSTKINRNQHVREHFKDRTSRIRADNATLSSFIRGLFHLPNCIFYAIIYVSGIFGYFDTRIPRSTLEKAEKNYRRWIEEADLATDIPWFKSLEYYVINRIPTAVPRMYNYLVIAGLFRSLSFIFLVSAWWVLFFSSAYQFTGVWPLKSTDNLNGDGVGFFEFAILSSASVFSLMAYIKFQRRYAEETIFAFAYAE